MQNELLTFSRRTSHLCLKKQKRESQWFADLDFAKMDLDLQLLSDSIHYYIVRPILEYCAQVLTYTRYSQLSQAEAPRGFAKEIEHFQTQTLKKLINCQRNTPPAIVFLFCGVEPLTCRLEILKLRYFWRTLHTPHATITNRILTYRKQNLLTFDKGSGHQVFNICCRYDAINIWHGIASAKLNPLRSIKKIILLKNLRNDLEKGRKYNCIFTKIFLSNPFTYQKNYHLVKPFNKQDYSSFRKDSKILVEALLDPNSCQKECQDCGLSTEDFSTHFLTQCSKLSRSRHLLQLKLLLYNFPTEHFPFERNLLPTRRWGTLVGGNA